MTRNVTGKVEDATGNPVHCRVYVESLSTPLFGNAGVVTGHTVTDQRTHATTGAFSFLLKPGRYLVTYETRPKQTSFQIEVLDEAGDVAIDDLLIISDVQDLGEAILLADTNGVDKWRLTIIDGELDIVAAAPDAVTVSELVLRDIGTDQAARIRIENGELKIL
jgi:hypothetical protein